MNDTEHMFDAGKIGVFLDSITHSTENRRGTETKIVVLGLRVDPFDRVLALALDSRARDTLFALSSDKAREHVKAATFALGVLRQNLHLFTTPDTTDATRALLQVQITGITAKVHKDRSDYVLTFKASFGPADKHELEYIEAWRGNQRFVMFERAAPSLDFEAESDGDDADEAPPTRPDPMWDDGDPPPAIAADAASDAETEAAMAPQRRGTRKKTGKHEPEKERKRQRKAGRAKSAVNGSGDETATGAAEA